MPFITISNIVEQVQSDIIIYGILYQGSVNGRDSIKRYLFDYGTAHVTCQIERNFPQNSKTRKHHAVQKLTTKL